jgi:tRNA(fMet)-specific endonuclease VapC
MLPAVIDPRYLLDTNFCIDLLVGRSPRGAERVERCLDGELVTSAIVYAEVTIGAEQRGQGEAAAALFRQVPVLPFDSRCGDGYATLPFKRGNFDRLIAAHALALGLVVVTSNEGDFAGIPGLKLENWTK